MLACQATVGPGDSAVVLTPLWPNVAEAVRLAAARKPIEVPLASRRIVGFASISIGSRPPLRLDSTRLIALASPGNPTAWTATADDWRGLLALCERHDLWLLADGVYERIVFDGPVAPSPLAIPGARPRTIVAQSFSKAYRMTGWRVGYAIAPPELARSMTHLQEFVVSHAPGIAQEAARVALLEGEPFILESQARYARHRQIALDRFRSMAGVTVPEPTGAFYVFPRFEGLADSLDFCRWLVVEKQVGLAPGVAFGLGGEGHIRLCFAVEEPILREALERLEAGWAEYRDRVATDRPR